MGTDHDGSGCDGLASGAAVVKALQGAIDPKSEDHETRGGETGFDFQRVH